MNTEISYLYRDADNYKSSNTIVIEGELRFSDIQPYLHEGTYFIPSQVDLDGLNGNNIDSDHPYHELAEDDFELTEANPTISLTAKQLITQFKQAHERGWDDKLFFEEIATQAAAAANGFFLREPKELSHLTDLIVRLQSDEFGLEDFKHFNLEHALDKIVELYVEALKLDDGVERIIGLAVNPQVQNEFDEIVTVFRGLTKKQNFKVKLNDFSFACGKLGIGDPEKVTETQEYVFNDVNNFDHLKIFLKQNEFLVS